MCGRTHARVCVNESTEHDITSYQSIYLHQHQCQRWFLPFHLLVSPLVVAAVDQTAFHLDLPVLSVKERKEVQANVKQ